MFDLDVVLSLFDGAGMGQEALKRSGLTYRVYLASEIDKPAMRVAMRNHPQTIQLGDITQLKSEFLPQPISLLMGGSPCQGFSQSNTAKGNKHKLAFDHPESKLFFEFIRILDETKPDFVFLENVKMKPAYRDIITDMISEVRGYKVEPVLWDSALVSAQRRVRNYWTDIPGFVIPEDRGILLEDVLQDASEDVPETKDVAEYNPIETKNYVQFDKSGKGFKSQQDRYFYRDNKFGTLGTNGGHFKVEVNQGD
jgi:DNA (cytosine-5)-methyltransferase 3A